MGVTLDIPDVGALGRRTGPSRFSLFLLRRDLVIEWANETGKQLARHLFDREPNVGDSMLDFAAAGTAEDFRRNVERAFEGTSTSVRRELVYPTGARFVFDVSYEPIADQTGHVTLVSFSSVDVTDDVVRSDVVRLLAAGLSQTTDGVLVARVEPDFEIMYVNDAALRIGGYPREEVIGRNCRFLQGADTDQEAVRTMRAALREGRACEVLLRNYRKTGELFFNQLTLSPIRGSDGKATHYIGVQRDVTSERRLQERLARVDRMEALGRLASGVAHDMNNFLMAVLANVELMQDNPSTAGNHATELTEIESTIQRARSLSSQLVTFARIGVSERKVVNVGDHVRGLRALLARLIPADISLELSIRDEPLCLDVDPAHLDQLLVNLALNARDAMPGGGALVIDARAVDRASETDGAPAVRIEVSDTGEGMPEHVAARAFEPFFTTKVVGQGSGLGLATCLAVANHYRGHIALASKLGAGTTCTVWLPRSSERASAFGSGTGIVGGRGTKRLAQTAGQRVLVADDDDGVRFAITRMLRRSGYEVLEADDGDVAVELLDRVRVDALVTDVVLPGRSGGQLAEAASRRNPDVSLVFMTGYAGQEVAPGRLPLGAALFEKPFALRELAEKLNELIALKNRPAAE